MLLHLAVSWLPRSMVLCDKIIVRTQLGPAGMHKTMHCSSLSSQLGPRQQQPHAALCPVLATSAHHRMQAELKQLIPRLPQAGDHRRP